MVTIVSTKIQGENTVFELSIPSSMFRSFFLAVSSLSSLGHQLQHKSRIASAGIKQTPEQIKIVQDHVKKFEKLCLKHYDACIESGLTPNQAVSEANKALKELCQFNTSYDIVRGICRRARPLRPR